MPSPTPASSRRSMRCRSSSMRMGSRGPSCWITMTSSLRARSTNSTSRTPRTSSLVSRANTRDGLCFEAINAAPSLRALAKQSRVTKKAWIASSQGLLAMTGLAPGSPVKSCSRGFSGPSQAIGRRTGDVLELTFEFLQLTFIDRLILARKPPGFPVDQPQHLGPGIADLVFGGQCDPVAVKLWQCVRQKPAPCVVAQARTLDVFVVQDGFALTLPGAALHPVVAGVVHDFKQLVGHVVMAELAGPVKARREAIPVLDHP